MTNEITPGVSLLSSKNRLAVRRASWDFPLPGFPDKYKVLKLSLLAALSSLRCCVILPTSDPRGETSCVGSGGRIQNGETPFCNCSSRVCCWFSFSSTSLSFSSSSLSFCWSFFSLSWTSCWRSSTFSRTFRNSSVGKLVWFWISRIFRVERSSAWNIVFIFKIAFWKSPLER